MRKRSSIPFFRGGKQENIPYRIKPVKSGYGTRHALYTLDQGFLDSLTLSEHALFMAQLHRQIAKDMGWVV